MGEKLEITSNAYLSLIYRYNSEWKFNAVGQGTQDKGLSELAARFL